MLAWSTFFSVISGAAATLTGLLFVAMSMNAAVALSRGPRGSRRLTEQAFENYLAVLMVSLLALIPGMSLTAFGRTILMVTASWTLWVLVRLYQAAAETTVHESRLSAIRHHLSTLIGFGLLIYSAGRMAFGGPDMPDVMAAAVIVLLFSATAKAWGLLDRIGAATQVSGTPYQLGEFLSPLRYSGMSDPLRDSRQESGAGVDQGVNEGRRAPDRANGMADRRRST